MINLKINILYIQIRWIKVGKIRDGDIKHKIKALFLKARVNQATFHRPSTQIKMLLLYQQWTLI